MKMDINDFNSPLRGLLNSPARRFTPAVPIPDWNKLDSVIKSPQNVSASTEEQDLKKPDIQKLATPHSVIQPVSEHGSRSLQSPDIRRLGSEIPSTPGSAFGGLINPHANIPVLNPVVSGPMQAKHSIKIQNCVSTVDSDCVLNLLNIYQKTRFSEYNPSRFHGLIMRLRAPKTTALLFGSGKMVCTGARNERDSYLAVYKFLRIVQKVGYPAVKMLDFKIQNFVATADIRFPVRLEMLHHSHGQFSSYEPELFPGLVYRMVRPRMVLLIFVNGKIVFTGAKSRSDIEDALDIIYPILRSFKKN